MRVIAVRSMIMPLAASRPARSSWLTGGIWANRNWRATAPITFLSGLTVVFFTVCEFHTLTLPDLDADSVWTSHMRKRPSRKLLDRSCSWIRDHWDASNLDLPSDLLEEWIYEPSEDEADPPGFYFSVFTFGYAQYLLTSQNVPLGQKQSIPIDQVLELFKKWQLKLALAELHLRTDIRVSPLPLFAFPEGEKIQLWR